MVLTFEQEVSFEDLKHTHKVEFAKITHDNTMAELNIQLEIAKAQIKVA